MTLYVVYVPDTGHVVGAVNASGGVPPGDDVGALVGSALPMRISVDGEVATLPLLGRQLALHKVDDEPRVFDDPLGFGVEMSGDKPKPSLMPLTAWDEELTFTVDSLVVTVPVANANDATKVLGIVSDGQDIHVVPRVMKAGEDTVELPVTVPIGKHAVLVLVARWAGRLQVVTKS